MPRLSLTVVFVAALVAMAVAAALTPAPSAADPLKIGYSDLAYELNAWTGQVEKTMAVQRFYGSDVARINVAWSRLAPLKPAQPSWPGSAGYNFTRLDQAVRAAAAVGLKPHFTVYQAPKWAQAANGSEYFLSRGAWLPDPQQVQLFAAALARRYSGSYPDPLHSGRSLPRVRDYEVWNEENFSNYLAPQWLWGENLGAGVYRNILNAFYAGSKYISSKNRIITGGTAPTLGATSKIGTLAENTRPLEFWRGVFCLTPELQRSGVSGCQSPSSQAHFDVLAYHPINLKGGGFDHGDHPDDVMVADTPELIKTLRAAELRNTIVGDDHPVWATELWWETNPPDTRRGISLTRQSRNMIDSLYQFDRFGVRRAYFLQVRDTPRQPADDYQAFHSYQTGIFYNNWDPKPAARAMLFPFKLVNRTASHGYRVWGRPIKSGILEVQYRSRSGEWVTARRLRVTARKTFQSGVSLPGGSEQTARAKMGSYVSLPYSVK